MHTPGQPVDFDKAYSDMTKVWRTLAAMWTISVDHKCLRPLGRPVRWVTQAFLQNQLPANCFWHVEVSRENASLPDIHYTKRPPKLRCIVTANLGPFYSNSICLWKDINLFDKFLQSLGR